MAINSKAKGKRGELAWAKLCREHGFKEVRRTAQYCGNTGEASDCVGLPFIHQEVKNVERLNLRAAMEQSKRDAKEGEIPIVAHKTSRKEWLVTIKADDFFKLYDCFMEVH